MHAMARRTWTVVALGLVWGGFASSRARAAEPFVNLGFTSFVDGFGDPTGTGLAIVQYLRFARATSLKDQNGDAAAGFVNPRLDAVVSLTQLLYTFPTPHGFPGAPGLGVIVPIVYLNSEFGAGGASLQDNGLGVGDIFVGPSLQFRPVSVGGHPAFFHRLEFDVQVPVGSYDQTKQLNQGNHAWGLNPFWAATLLAGPLEISWRLHYLYNFEDTAPVFGPPGAPPLTSTQAGQAFHANVAASYEVVPKVLRLGVASYVFRQLTDDRENGKSIAGSQEQVVGVGPGLVWFPSPYDLVFLNFYFETAVRNRFQSNSVQIRWGHAFATF